MTPYAEQLKRYLAAYKVNRLGVSEDGVWRSNGRSYPHILPEALHRLNVLEGYRSEFWRFFEANSASFALHTDFHHLNSSQAFTFNVFFPWMQSEASQEALLDALGLARQGIRAWSFERMIDPSERTSVDFFAELGDESRLLVEVKLTEEHFGQCVPVEAHRRKLAETYRPRLAGRIHEESLEETTFFLNYQLFRNVSHLTPGSRDTLLLFLPRANTVTWAEAESFIASHLVEGTRDSVRLVAAEDVISRLGRAAPQLSGRLEAHVELLVEKYLETGTLR